ncbi:MAG TPA: SDR family NAD(P)-dependent oxidoreductase [Steroidobacteraceae bacterium]|nr:SDR family NAD(P)-dependent oxidoreductase [Steroidobacteraceae bacterium]
MSVPDFKDRLVVVTGGTGVLGAAVLGALLEAGALCQVPFRSEASLQRSPHRGNPRVTFAALGDLADESAVDRYYASLENLWASIHVAGAYGAAPIARSDKSLLQAQLDANLMSAYVCSRAAALALRRLGGGGRIVNVAARQALDPRRGSGSVAYTISKAAVAALTTSLAMELVKDGILVNAVAPSIMDTPDNRAGQPDADYRHWSKVEEVAAAILFLASPKNTVTSGAVVPVYGGA